MSTLYRREGKQKFTGRIKEVSFLMWFFHMHHNREGDPPGKDDPEWTMWLITLLKPPMFLSSEGQGQKTFLTVQWSDQQHPQDLEQKIKSCSPTFGLVNRQRPEVVLIHIKVWESLDQEKSYICHLEMTLKRKCPFFHFIKDVIWLWSTGYYFSEGFHT